MEERGELFLEKISMSRTKVAKLCHTFIKDGAVSVHFIYVTAYLLTVKLNSFTNISSHCLEKASRLDFQVECVNIRAQAHV